MERATLVDISTKAPLQDIILTSDRFLIGRGLQNSRIIEDISISRTHCILEQNDGDWCISDKSSNGTWLNGQLLDKTKSHKLTNGDVIGLSDTVKFVYQKPSNDDIQSANNTDQKVLSDNDILDIAETVIAEVEALDADFYMNKFDETVFGGTCKNSETTNPSQLLSNKNKQNVNVVNVKTGLNAIHSCEPISIHRPTVVNIVQKSTKLDNIQQAASSTCVQQPQGSSYVQQSFDLNAAKPGSSSVIQQTPSDVLSKSQTNQQPSCSKDNSNMQVQKNNLDHVEDELQCSICTEMFVKAVTLNCSHTFCKFCIMQWQKNQSVCPICRTKITMLFPTLVVDNFIEKVLEDASEEIKQHRREIIAEREAACAPSTATASTSTPAPATSTSHTSRRTRSADEPIEISSSEASNSDDEDDDNMDYSGSDWEYDYEESYEDYNGRPGCYYGGYGHCYSCGQRGHWANGCPNRRKR